MSVKDDVKAELNKLGIAFDEDATTAELKALLPDNDSAKSEEDEIIVKDPMVLRPVELPLVITLPESANDAQREYAKTLNAYAYINPEKWAVKKDDVVDATGKVVALGLINKLKGLGKDPSKLSLYTGGGDGNLTIGSKLPTQ